MKPLLFLTQRIPYPPNKGDKLRAFAILRHLAKSWQIHLGCFIDDPDDWRHLDALRPFCADIACLGLNRKWATLRSAPALLRGRALGEYFYRDGRMRRWTQQVYRAHKPAATFVFSSVMGQYAASDAPDHRLVTDFVDVDSEKWRQYGANRGGPMGWIYRREGEKLLTFEGQLAARSHCAVFVSPPEASLFRALAPEMADKVLSISNGLDQTFFTPDPALPDPYPPGGPVIALTGAMDYWPNIDAALWFADEILPRLRRTRRDLRFYVVGSNPAPALQALKDVTVTGRVADIRPYLQHAAIAVAPMRIARGIQNKILEAMAMAKATVTTPAGLEGIDAEPGKHLMLAADAENFAAAVERILGDDGLSSAIGSAARDRILERYGWADKLQEFDRLLEA